MGKNDENETKPLPPYSKKPDVFQEIGHTMQAQTSYFIIEQSED